MHYPAEFYRALHVGHDEDVDFYRRVCSGTDSVLEFGCGWGRVCGPLAADGLEVVGVDLHEGMLAMADPSLDVRLGDMRTMDVARTFDRVIIPYNGIYACLSSEDQVATFSNACRHLNAGGLLVFDGYSAEQFHNASDAVSSEEHDEPSLVGVVDVEGVTYDVFEKSSWDRARQFIHAHYTHLPRNADVSEVCTEIPQRYLLREELHSMMESAGLELQVVHGGFDQHVWDEDSTLMIVTARKG